MDWLTKHGQQVFILCLAPVVGFISDLLLNKKLLKGMLFTSSAFLLPLAFGYVYTIPYTGRILALIVASCLYCFLSAGIEKKSMKIFIASASFITAFCTLGYHAFLNAMWGNERILQTWHAGHYRVDNLITEGFSGRPTLRFTLNRKAWIPILSRQVDEVENDTSTSCVVPFDKTAHEFNRCNGHLNTARISAPKKSCSN